MPNVSYSLFFVCPLPSSSPPHFLPPPPPSFLLSERVIISNERFLNFWCQVISIFQEFRAVDIEASSKTPNVLKNSYKKTLHDSKHFLNRHDCGVQFHITFGCYSRFIFDTKRMLHSRCRLDVFWVWHRFVSNYNHLIVWESLFKPLLCSMVQNLKFLQIILECFKFCCIAGLHFLSHLPNYFH